MQNTIEIYLKKIHNYINYIIEKEIENDFFEVFNFEKYCEFNKTCNNNKTQKQLFKDQQIIYNKLQEKYKQLIFINNINENIELHKEEF